MHVSEIVTWLLWCNASAMVLEKSAITAAKVSALIGILLETASIGEVVTAAAALYELCDMTPSSWRT